MSYLEVYNVYPNFVGAPSKCGIADLPTSYTFRRFDQIYGSITLCGKPQPMIYWMVGDQSFNGTVNLSKGDQHQYTYSFKRRITSFEICGKYLSYQAIGSQNKMIIGLSLLLMDGCKCFTLSI